MVLLFYLPLDLIVWNEFVRLAQFERGQNQAGVLFEHLTGVLLVQYQVPIRCVESVAKILFSERGKYFFYGASCFDAPLKYNFRVLVDVGCVKKIVAHELFHTKHFVSLFISQVGAHVFLQIASEDILFLVFQIMEFIPHAQGKVNRPIKNIQLF